MGRVYKTFIARRGGKKVKGKALIDTGADTTVFDRETACSLGFDVRKATPAEVEGYGGRRRAGARFSVDMQVGQRRAQIDVFVPADRRRTDKIIGHDFLQEVKAPLDFDREHRHVFSGSMDLPVNAGLRVHKLTGKRAEVVRRKMMRAYRRKR